MICKNILVIEDDLAVSQSIKDVLEIQGYQVTTAIDGDEGIAAMLHAKPFLVLLDLMMPGTNGWQFLDIQRSLPELNDTPVIICSAFQETAKSVQAHAILPKPVHLDELYRVVNSFCDNAE